MLFVDLLGSIPSYPGENSVPFDERTIVGGTRTPSQKGAAVAALREMRGPLPHDLEPLPIQECELAVGPAAKDLLLDGLPGPRVPLVRVRRHNLRAGDALPTVSTVFYFPLVFVAHVAFLKRAATASSRRTPH